MCEGNGSAGVGFEGGVVAMSAYMGGTCGSGVLASAGAVLEICVVRGVGGLYCMCMCLARGGVCVVGGEWVGGLGQFLGGWGGVMSVCVVSLFSLCIWQVQVSVYCARRIPVHLRCTQFQSCCILSRSAS